MSRPRKLSPETRAKIAAKARGRVVAPETRAKIRAAHRLDPPPEDVAEAKRLYPQMSLTLLAERMGYCRRLLTRALRAAGVAIRPSGFQPGNTLGQMQRGQPKRRSGRHV